MSLRVDSKKNVGATILAEESREVYGSQQYVWRDVRQECSPLREKLGPGPAIKKYNRSSWDWKPVLDKSAAQKNWNVFESQMFQKWTSQPWNWLTSELFIAWDSSPPLGSEPLPVGSLLLRKPLPPMDYIQVQICIRLRVPKNFSYQHPRPAEKMKCGTFSEARKMVRVVSSLIENNSSLI